MAAETTNERDTTTVYRIDGTGDDAWLLAEAGRCTCDGGGEFPHRPDCGWEPVVQIHTWRDAVHAAAALSSARAENERLTEEVAGLRRYEDEAERQFSEAADEWGRLTAEVEQLRAERDEARRQVQAASERHQKMRSALSFIRSWRDDVSGKGMVYADDLLAVLNNDARAALAAAQPTEATQ